MEHIQNDNSLKDAGVTAWMRRSVRAKLLVTVGIAVVSGVLLASVASALRETDRRFQSKHAEIVSIGAALAASIAPYIEANERRKIAATLNAIGKIPSITYARVQRTDGKLIYEVGSGILLSHGSHKSQVNQQIGPFTAMYLGSYPFEVSIVNAGVGVGVLNLISDLSELRSALIESLLQSVMFGLLAALIGMLLSHRFQRGITGPISELTSTMADVRRSHDYSRIVARTSDDEIGKLVDAFNEMLVDIRLRDQKLADHRENLEDIILTRTAELIEARMAAESANAAKSEFLATMSHEIRTPMNGMLVMAELLAASNMPPRLQRLADVIVKSGNGLLAIINDILDFSKIEAGKLELEEVPVNLAEIMDDALRLFAERAMSKGLDLTGYVAPEVPLSIAADPVRLSQILTNLINNALKFTDRGQVELRAAYRKCDLAEKAQAILELSVSDTGIGIPANKLDTIFNSFAQAESSTSRSYGGTGIGLTICRRMVDMMGGKLTVISEVGKGSTFTASIPMAVLDTTQIVETPERASGRIVLVAMPPSPSHDVLLNYARDAGLTAISLAPEDLAASPRENFSAVFAAADTLPFIAASLSAQIPEAVIAVTNLGDTPTIQSAGSLEIHAEVQRPFCSNEIRPLLASIANGPQTFKKFIAHHHASSQSKPPSYAGIHILAADDCAINREVLIEALSRLQVDVTCVEDGAAAVAKARSGTFDLIFMDGSMPVLDGYEATRAIRLNEKSSNHPRIPIIALTAHVVGDQANQWRDAGMDDCVTKPFTLAALEACLGKHVGEPAGNNKTAQAELIQDHCTVENPSELLDTAVLDSIAEMQQSNDDLVGRVISLYAEHAPQALERLCAFRKETSDDEIASAAHALKSLSRNVGALRVGNLCDRIEIEARSGNAVFNDTDGRHLLAALNDTISALKQYGNKSPQNQTYEAL